MKNLLCVCVCVCFFFVYVSTCNAFLHILNHTTTVYLQAALTSEHFVELSLITDQPKFQLSLTLHALLPFGLIALFQLSLP